MRVDFNAIEWIQYTEKGRFKPPAINDKLVMTLLQWEAGYSPPLHSHEDEQITYVLSGVLEIDVEDRGIKRYEYVRPGQAMVIAPYAPHRLIGIEDGTALEMWMPGLRHRAAEKHFRVGQSPIVVPDLIGESEHTIFADSSGNVVVGKPGDGK
jgi:quercetin dioxygenase-like cupin family protein